MTCHTDMPILPTGNKQARARCLRPRATSLLTRLRSSRVRSACGDGARSSTRGGVKGARRHQQCTCPCRVASRGCAVGNSSPLRPRWWARRLWKHRLRLSLCMQKGGPLNDAKDLGHASWGGLCYCESCCRVAGTYEPARHMAAGSHSRHAS
jgi:hypothetical protein